MTTESSHISQLVLIDSETTNYGIPALTTSIKRVAESTEMSLDFEVYKRAGRDPYEPILFAGSLNAPLAFFGRDLGKDEVLYGQPLIGGAGRRVRSALYSLIEGKKPSELNRELPEILDRILLTNTVPYKPVGNMAYPVAVKERFRPYIEALLACYWTGSHIITLGREAFFWFEKYAGKEAIAEHWARDERFETQIECSIISDATGEPTGKNVTIAPLPHPSPLNAAYLRKFPELLRKRLDLTGLF